MGHHLKTKAPVTGITAETVEFASRLFDDAVRSKASRLIDVDTAHYHDDMAGFSAIVRTELDADTFDAALDLYLDEHRVPPPAAARIRTLSLQFSMQDSGPMDRDGMQTITDIFFIPVSGERSVLEGAYGSPAMGTMIVDALHQSGLTLDRSTIVLGGELLDVDAVAATSACAGFSLTRGFASFAEGDHGADARAYLDHVIADLVVTDSEASRRAYGPSSMLIVGSYVRAYNHREHIDMDGLTALIHGTEETYEARETASRFSDQLDGAFSGIRIGLPRWLGLACSEAASDHAVSMLRWEADQVGLEDGTAYDEIAIEQIGDEIVVEASRNGYTLGPVSVPTRLVSHDPATFMRLTATAGKSLVPGGHLSTGRSMALN
jgi:hypothetical protein